MRTTIDLPDDLHRAAKSLARDRHQSLSRTVEELMRRGLHAPVTPGNGDALRYKDGFPVLESVTGHPITAEDVRRLDDE